MSFKQAADELCVTPPAVSQQIKQLEEVLGVQLFVRGNRKLEFTKAGADYWQLISHRIDELDQETTLLQERNRQASLSVSVMPPLAGTVVIPNLGHFQKRYPDLSLHIESNIKNISIEQGEADVAIRFGGGQWPRLINHKLMGLRIQPIFPPNLIDHYDLDSEEGARSIPLVHMQARPTAWAQWFEGAELGTPTPDNEYFLDDYPSAIEAAKHLGAALALMPIEQPLVDSGEVIALGTPYPIDDAVYAVYKPEDKDNPIIQAFVHWLDELLQSTFTT